MNLCRVLERKQWFRCWKTYLLLWKLICLQKSASIPLTNSLIFQSTPRLRSVLFLSRNPAKMLYTFLILSHSFMFFCFHFYHCVRVYGCIFCMLLFNFVNYIFYYYVYVFLLLCMFCSVYSVSLCFSMYCSCVNVCCITATGCQPNWS